MLNVTLEAGEIEYDIYNHCIVNGLDGWSSFFLPVAEKHGLMVMIPPQNEGTIRIKMMETPVVIMESIVRRKESKKLKAEFARRRTEILEKEERREKLLKILDVLLGKPREEWVNFAGKLGDFNTFNVALNVLNESYKGDRSRLAEDLRLCGQYVLSNRAFGGEFDY